MVAKGKGHHDVAEERHHCLAEETGIVYQRKRASLFNRGNGHHCLAEERGIMV